MSSPSALARTARRFSPRLPTLRAPRDWSLRVKLAIALLVPGILAIVLGGLRIADQTSQAAEFDRVSRFASAQGDVETLLQRLQVERLRATEFVAAGRTDDPKSLDGTFGDVDAAGNAIAPIVAALYADDAAIVPVDQATRQGLSRLAALRTLTLTSNAPAVAIVSRYTDLISLVSQLDDRLLLGVNTTETNGLTTALSGLAVARNEASLQEAVIDAATRTTAPVGPALADLQAGNARLGAGLADFRAALDVGQRVRYASLIAGPSNSARATLVASLMAQNPAEPLPPGIGGNAGATYSAFLSDIDSAETGVRTELTTTTADSRANAIGLAWVNTVLLLLALLIGSVVVGLIVRAVITSLRTLRRSALDVAWTRLPDAVRRMRSGAVPDVDVTPVPITTHEEIGEVARAFDAVHTEAVRLAAEQATLQNNVNRMFINLSRRSKSLVDKQLQLIEGLERNEQDSDQLSALFRLDHLATRMRRNSENLLVLAGTDLNNRTSRPVPIVDVLRAAVGEVERYERIVVEQPPALVVAGRTANDLQHLFAELLDNATNFSSPDSKVVMTAQRSREGAIVVEIADRGVGMRTAELADANAQLSRTNMASADTGRRMGLLVVGRLASRHGIQVELTATPDRPGLTARVMVPAHLVSGPTVPDKTRRDGEAARPIVPVQTVAAPDTAFRNPPAQQVPVQQAPPAPASDLPKRVPAPPMVSAAATSSPIDLFAPVQRPAESESPAHTGPQPSRAVAEAPLSSLRNPSRPVRIRSSFLTDPESGRTRVYRPVKINWLPDPITGTTPDDVPAGHSPEAPSGSA